MRSLVAACCAVLLLGACGSGDEPSGEPSGEPSSGLSSDPGSETSSAPSSEPGGSPSETGSPSPTAPATPATYVALGDSYTAALGVPDSEDDSGCSRSTNNYPSLVAEELDLVLDDVSCSGADTLALVGSQQTSSGPVPPQFLAVVPGVEVVTMGMGGNDEGLFRDLVGSCLAVASEDPTGSPCRDSMATAGGGDEGLDRIGIIETRLTSALTGIKDRVPDAAVVLVGYPQLVPARGTCDTLPLADGDYAYVRELTEALGKATAAAAAAAGTGYVDVLRASRGHDVCAGPEAWVNGIGNDQGRAAAPLHPFAEEQTAVAELVVAELAKLDRSDA